MSDDFTTIKRALEEIEVADIERHRPPPPKPRTEVEAYAQALDRARSATAFTVDSDWLVR
jgi:hypothetical protein